MADSGRISTAHHAAHLHSDDSIKSKLHQWINRVKPANSFISIADHEHASSLDDTSITAAAWMHVDSVLKKQQVWTFADQFETASSKMLCLHRWKIWWTIPKLLTSELCPEKNVPPETYFLLSQFQDGSFLLLLPVIDQNMGFTLEGSVSYQAGTDTDTDTHTYASKGGNFLVIHGHDISEGDLNVSTGSNRDTSEINLEVESTGSSGRVGGGTDRKAVLVSVGTDVFTLISQSMAIVKMHLRDQLDLPSENQSRESIRENAQSDALSSTGNEPLIADRNENQVEIDLQEGKGKEKGKEKGKGKGKGSLRMNRTRALGPSFANYFGWCTWDSFYTDLSTNRVIQGLKSFKRTGVTPRFLILDDGWQSTDVDNVSNGNQYAGRLTSLDANFKFSPYYDISSDKLIVEDVLPLLNTLPSSLSVNIDSSATIDSYSSSSSGSNTVSEFPYRSTPIIEDEYENEKEEENENENENESTAKGITDPGVNDRLLSRTAGHILSSRQSLSDLISHAKEDYDIKHMIVWHTLTGYWGGVQVDDEQQQQQHQQHQQQQQLQQPQLQRQQQQLQRQQLQQQQLLRQQQQQQQQQLQRQQHQQPQLQRQQQQLHPQQPQQPQLQQYQQHQQSAMSIYSPSITYADITSTMQRMSVAQTLDLEPFHSKGIGLIDPSRIGLFYKDYHKNLRDMGVDGVKVDAQALISSLKGPKGGGYELASNYHIALKSSVGEIFGTSKENVNDDNNNDDDISNNKRAEMPIEYPVIHCMGHSQGVLLSLAALYDNLEHSLDDYGGFNVQSDIIRRRKTQTQTSTHTRTRTHTEENNGRGRQAPVIRGSDDFWPLDGASHGPHLYVNALNSLFLSQIAVQDWDMFQSSLGRTSRMHACARAVSGGPVYVSDKPSEHDSDIINHLAFPDGSVPRCLRNARPPSRSLFLDPQRHSNTPLLLQNINPSGGLVIAAFNILGAVLENDKDLFRLLQPSGITWATPALQELARDYTAKGGGKTVLPVDEIEEFKNALSIDCIVSAMDIEEVDKSIQRGHESVGYVARRLSDGQLFDCVTVSSEVPIFLKTVYDYDVISFAEKHYVTASAITLEQRKESGGLIVAESQEENQARKGNQEEKEEEEEERLGSWTMLSRDQPPDKEEEDDEQGQDKLNVGDSDLDNVKTIVEGVKSLGDEYAVASDKWIAVVGALNMFNPGGSVLSASLKGSELQLEVLGFGDYMIVTNCPSLQSRARVVSSVPLGLRDKEGHGKYMISTNITSITTGSTQQQQLKSIAVSGSNSTNTDLYVLNLNVKVIPKGFDLSNPIDDVMQNEILTSSSSFASTATSTSTSASARDNGDQGAIVTINLF